MTIKAAQAICRKLGYTLVSDAEYDEFIVKLKGTPNDHPASYHTHGRTQEDLESAVRTCRAMWAHNELRGLGEQIAHGLEQLNQPDPNRN